MSEKHSSFFSPDSSPEERVERRKLVNLLRKRETEDQYGGGLQSRGQPIEWTVHLDTGGSDLEFIMHSFWHLLLISGQAHNSLG